MIKVLCVVLGPVELVAALPEVVICVNLVPGDARTEHVDQRETLMLDSILYQLSQVLRVPGEPARDVTCARDKSQGNGVYRVLSHPLWSRLCDKVPRTRGRSLSRCQAIDLVVHYNVSNVEIPSHRVYKMPQSDAVSVPVSARHHNVQVGVCELCSCRHRHCPSVEAVETVRGYEPRQVAGTAYSRTYKQVLRIYLKVRNRLHKRIQDAEISASRAPVGPRLTLVL